MRVDECPLPEVADALRPYIKPRAEVTSVRQALHKHLQGQIGQSNAPLTAVNLSTVNVASSQEPSLSTSGVRRAYLRALQAHTNAQAKYDALKSELAALQSASTHDNVKSGITQPRLESHIALLRQRENQRRLQILERTFAGIDDAGKGLSSGSLDDVVKQRIGDPSLPPTTSASVFAERPDMDLKILQLKKAILSVKRGLDDRENARLAFWRDEKPPYSVEAEMHGLQAALGELTAWMEAQLVLIGNSENGAPSVTPPSHADKDRPSQVPSTDDIGRAYEEYLAARHNLIQTVNSPATLEVDLSTIMSSNTDNRRDLPSTKTTPAEVVLNHIPRLAWSKREEASLLQQSSFLRRQIASAESETERLVARLADESHLVHPGAARGKDWADAAEEAGRETKEAVHQRLRAGAAFSDAAKKVLEDIEGLPNMFDGVTVG